MGNNLILMSNCSYDLYGSLRYFVVMMIYNQNGLCEPILDENVKTVKLKSNLFPKKKKGLIDICAVQRMNANTFITWQLGRSCPQSACRCLQKDKAICSPLKSSYEFTKSHSTASGGLSK